jgi:hypothetical protein
LGAFTAAADPNEPSPISVRRVLIAPERIAPELERVRQGTLVKMPREEFEARLRRAEQAAALSKNPPRLIEAAYRATMTENALTGTGQWKVVNPAAAGGILPLTSMNLALQKVRIQKTSLDSTEAVLGDVNGRGLGLLVEQPGELGVVFDWTARGEADGTGIRHLLQVPPSVVSTFELNVPADRVLSVDPDTCLLVGPLPAEAPERRTWRIDLGNRSQLDLTVRHAGGAGQHAPLVTAQVQSRYDLGPDLVEADFEFKIRVTPTSQMDHQFDCDPILRPYEVKAPGLESWEFAPSTSRTVPSTVVVHFHEPIRSGTVRIRCVAPFGGETVWTCPSMKLRGALDRGETLLVRVPPELRLENWKPGSFRISSHLLEGSGSHLLTLARSLTSGGTVHRPSAVLRIQTVELRAKQLSWWQLRPNTSTLTTEINYDVTRGHLFDFSVLLPTEWSVDEVKLNPPQLLRNWRVVHEKGPPRLVVDLRGSLGPTEDVIPAAGAQLTVRLRSSEPATTANGNRELSLPVVVPLNTRVHNTALAVSLDPGYEAEVKASVECSVPPDKGPWGRQPPDFFFSTSGPELSGRLWPHLKRSRFRARCNSELVIALGRAVMLTRLTLEPEVGNPEFIDLAVSAPTGGPWEWKTKRGSNRVCAVERLAGLEAACWLGVLGNRDALALAGSLLPLSTGRELYRLTLTRPLREPLVLESTFELPDHSFPGRPANQNPANLAGTPGARHWNVPLVAVLGGDHPHAEVAVHLSGMELVHAGSTGLREASSSAQSHAVLPWRTYRYGDYPFALTLDARGPASDRSTEAVTSWARLTTLVNREGRLLHHFEFQVTNWRQRTLMVRLPPGAEPLFGQANARWIPYLERETATAGGRALIALPVPRDGDAHRFEIAYAMTGPSWRYWTRVDAPANETAASAVCGWAPDLPMLPVVFRHIWRLPPGIKPILSSHFHHLSGLPESSAEDIREPEMEAAVKGDETSFCFRKLIDWMADKGATPEGNVSSGLEGRFDRNSVAEWTEWEEHPGQAMGEPLWLVRADLLPRLSAILVLVLAMATWAARRLPAWLRRTLLLLWLGGGVLGLLWLPESLQVLVRWPLLTGILLGLTWYVSSIVSASTMRSANVVTAAAFTLALVSLSSAPGQSPPDLYTVYLLPRTKQSDEKQIVLVPPDLIKQLDSTVRRGIDGLRQPVLISSRYEGSVTETTADLKAEYVVHCPKDDPVRFTLPLRGIQVKEALLDGAPVALQYVKTVSPLAFEGYQLEIKGRGTHALLMQFQAAVTVKGDDCDLKIDIPEVAQSRLTLDLQPGTSRPHVLACRGALRVTALPAIDGQSVTKGWHVEVDLGRVNNLHLRWRKEIGQPQAPTMQVREGYLWIFRPDASSLSAVLQYTVTRGVVNGLEVELPEDLEVLSAAVGRLPGDGADEGSPRLRRWTVNTTGRPRKLLLELQRPIPGGVQVMLELVPRQPFGPIIMLPLPAPLGVRPADGVGKDSYLAYRQEGMNFHVASEHQRIKGSDPKNFGDFWRSARMGDPGPQLHVYAFRRGPEGPYLRLAIGRPLTAIKAFQSVRWLVNPQRADLQLTARVTAPDRDVALVEWEVPKQVTIGDVTGADVRDWSQSGSRLQVWLRHPTTVTSLQLTGWKKLNDANPASSPGTRRESSTVATFSLSPIVMVSPRPATEYVRVHGVDGLAVIPQRVARLWPLPDSRLNSPEGIEYVTDQEHYEGAFLVQKRMANIQVRMLTHAEIVERRLTFRTILDCDVSAGGAQSLVIRARNWNDESVRLEAPDTAWNIEPVPDPSGRCWKLTVPAGALGRHRFTIGRSQPLKQGADILMPDVVVEGAGQLERWVAASGRELRADDARGLKAVPNPIQALSMWPASAERVRRAGWAWQIVDTDWRLRLLFNPVAGDMMPVQVLLCERSAAVLDRQRWTHQADYLLHQEMGTDLTILLPNLARLQSVRLDGAEVTPLQPEPTRLWLTLPGGAGAHRLQLRWLFEDGTESIRRPNLAGLKFEGLADPPTVWTVYLPPGFAITSVAEQEQPSRPAEHDLRRAEAQHQLSALLVERIQEGGPALRKLQLQAAQDEFYRLVRLVKHRWGPTAAQEAARQDLKARNQQLAQARGFEPIRAQAEHRAVDSATISAPGPAEIDFRSCGKPICWSMPPSSKAPRLSLITQEELHARWARIGSFLVGFLVILCGILSCFPEMVTRFQLLWPEQLVVVSSLSWVVFGLRWGALILVLVGVSARMLVVGAWIVSRWRKVRPGANGVNAASAGS